MADTDTLTRIVPQDGWSPIIVHRVPITQTITNIVGDNGDNAIYEGGSIKNFHAKIDWQDQYSGSRVPADIITESSEDNGETWTMNEVEEHEEGSFELDYEGHERDFEVRLDGTSLYIRYRWLMNGQEITDADSSLEHAITVTDYPVKLVIDAHYADNFGGHEIGANIFNSAKIFYKSGAVDDTKTKGDFTKPVQATLWADKDGWQSQTWSYTENGRTVTAQVGANITALRDVKIEAELNSLYTSPIPSGNEDGKDYWKLNRDGEDIVIFKEGYAVKKDDLRVTMTRNDNSTYEATDYWMPNNYALGRGKQSVTVQKGSLSTTLPVTVAYPTKVEVGNVNGGDFTKSSFYEYGEYVEPTHYKAYYECYDGTEGFDEVAEIDGEWEDKVEEETLGEYGSEVGTLTLGKKSYLYRAGLEPIDEENYLFIKDFKDIPFNYGLVKCYEPQWEKPVGVSPVFSGTIGDDYYEAYEIDEPSPEVIVSQDGGIWCPIYEAQGNEQIISAELDIQQGSTWASWFGDDRFDNNKWYLCAIGEPLTFFDLHYAIVEEIAGVDTEYEKSSPIIFK